MKLQVTFSQQDLSFHPDYDNVITVDKGTAKMQALVDGSLSGIYENAAITELRMGAFAQCAALTGVRLPNCTRFGQSRQFYACENVTELYLPKLKHIDDGAYTFYGMSKLKTVYLPELTTITTGFGGTFWGCEAAECIVLPKLSGAVIQSYTFRYCLNLHTLVLGGEVLCPLDNPNAFNNAGIAPGVDLRIYVADDLVESYKTAKNWSTLASRIKPISDWEGLQ